MCLKIQYWRIFRNTLPQNSRLEIITQEVLYEITNDFEFTTIIEKFDTFIAKCDNYEGTSVTVVQYLGITTIDSVDYFMTWHLNALSEEGITCNYPQIIQHSLKHNFRGL